MAFFLQALPKCLNLLVVLLRSTLGLGGGCRRKKQGLKKKQWWREGSPSPDISSRILVFIYKLLVLGVIVGVANLALLLARSESTYLKVFFRIEGGN